MIDAATAADVAPITRLEAVALGDDAWSEGLIREGVTGNVPTVRYLVARADAGVVGYAVASVVVDTAELQRIAVDRAYRRSGIATELLGAVVDAARESGADRVLLEVRDDNIGAIAFYAASGFVEIARRPRYYRDGGTAVVMSRALTGPDVKECTTA